jgi:protein-S-isoprenylcysteine O-methyltransferase Ste14
VLWAVWLIGAFGAKRTISSRAWWQRADVRFTIAVILLVLLSRSIGRSLLRDIGSFGIAANPLAAGIGLALCAAGIAFAIWARIVIGSNWGMPMTLKEGHELVTTGPYRYVRHPIYAGLLLAMLGSALVINLWWLAIFFLAALNFVYAAKKEEKLMSREFPNTYPAYIKRTKMLIPFLL